MRGTLTKLGPNHYKAQVYLGQTPDGRRRFATRRVKGTKREADAVLAELVAQATQGRLAPSVVLFGDWLEEWLRTAKNRGRWAPSTWRKHESAARLYLMPALAGVKLRALTPAHVARLYGDLAARLAPVTVLNAHRTLSQALEDAVSLELVGRNVASRVDVPTVPRDVGPSLTDAMVARLLELAALQGPLEHVWFRLAAFTGARPGELSALRWKVVDLDEAQLSILDTVTVGADDWAYTARGRPKRGLGRTIALDGGTVAVLSEWRDELEAIARRSGRPGLSPDAWVFPMRRVPGAERPMVPTAASKWWRTIRSDAGIPDGLPPYSLRHWHVSTLVRLGVGVNVVAYRAGHAQPTMTLNRYGRHAPAGDRVAADALSLAMAPPDLAE